MPVLLGEAQHGVLHDVERSLLVAHGEHGLLECTPLHAGEEGGQLAARCQGEGPPSLRVVVGQDDVTIMVFKGFCRPMDRIKTSTLNGAEIVIRCLQEEGVEYVFG